MAYVLTRAVSTDDFAGWLALQTNLALKGIIGIKAMAGISKTINQDSDADYYEVSNLSTSDSC